MSDVEDSPPEPAPSETSPEPQPETPPEEEPRSRRRLFVIGAIVLAALITFAFAFGATRYSAARSDLDDISAIRSVAGDFGAAALTYDYHDLAPFRRRMRAHATGTFKRQLSDGLSGLETLITTARSQSEATVKQIYVSDVDGHSSSAIVVVEAKAKNGDAEARTLPAAYIELQLVKTGGRWLIDGVSSLDLGSAVPGASLPGTTTTTTAPSK